MNKIKSYREHAGLAQWQAAEAIGVSQISFSRWERGERTVPESRQQKLAEVLGCNVDDLGLEEAETEMDLMQQIEALKPQKRPFSRMAWIVDQARAAGMEYGAYVAATTEPERTKGYEDYLRAYIGSKPAENPQIKYRRLRKAAEADRSGYISRMAQAMARKEIWSPAALANAAGIKLQAAGNYCTKGNIPSQETLQAICEVLGVTDEWLLAG